jgi:hypothetical protein
MTMHPLPGSHLGQISDSSRLSLQTKKHTRRGGRVAAGAIRFSQIGNQQFVATAPRTALTQQRNDLNNA